MGRNTYPKDEPSGGFNYRFRESALVGVWKGFCPAFYAHEVRTIQKADPEGSKTIVRNARDERW